MNDMSQGAPSSNTSTADTSNRKSRTIAWALFMAILLSAVSYSLGPLVVEITSSERNPFALNLTMRVGEIAVLAIFLVLSVRFAFGPKATVRNLTVSALFPKVLQGEPILRKLARSSFSLLSPRWIRRKVKTPMFWILVTNPTYFFLAWATAFVDTAVASVVLETWPLIMIFTLTYYGRTTSTSTASDRIDKTKAFAIAIAPIGIAIVILGQTGGFQETWTSDIRQVAAGVGLAFVAAFLAGISPVATIRYGEHQLQQEQLDTSQTHDDTTVALRLTWYSILGLLVADIVHIPIALALSLLTFGGATSISSEIVLGGLAIGALFGLGGILLRTANSIGDNPNRNSVLFLTPILSLVWLLWRGVQIPRLDLFYLGAALVIAVIIVVRNDPDQERDTMRYSEVPARSTRLSFMTLILSIWLFGTLLLLRDESFVQERLSWYGGEYWGLVALSATVFALIFGFRTSRLASRVNKEEDTMLRIFRTYEHLVKKDQMDPGILKSLRNLYRSGPRSIEATYHDTRRHILRYTNGLDDSSEADHRLLEIESELDALAHSKQRGREFVELVALALLALITIVLGIGARPQNLQPVLTRPVELLWTGFLSEVFVMLFLSTITFLLLGLFDQHRDRDLPLVVKDGMHGLGERLDDDRQRCTSLEGDDARREGDQTESSEGSTESYSVFFRHEENLMFQRLISVIVCLGMCIVFAFLLYDKWIP